MSAGESRLSRAIDRFSVLTGRAVSWLTLAMVLVTAAIVILRYVFDSGVIWLQESLTWMHAMVFMLGAAYTMQREEHVRVDIFYRDMSPVRRAIVNLFGVVFFVMPLCVFFIVESFDYVMAAWRIQEVSRDAGGLPYPAIPLLKSALLLMPITVALQGVSLAAKSIHVIRDR